MFVPSLLVSPKSMAKELPVVEIVSGHGEVEVLFPGVRPT
jgi:hypothetical protein